MTLKELLAKHKPMDSKTIRKRKRELNTKFFPSEMWFERQLFKHGVKDYRRNVCIEHRFFGDFVFKKTKLIVEIDGSSHIGKEDYDKSRDKLLGLLGYKVVRVRFNNDDDLNNALDVIKKRKRIKLVKTPEIKAHINNKASLIKLRKKENKIRIENYKALKRQYERIVNKKKVLIRKAGEPDRVVVLK